MNTFGLRAFWFAFVLARELFFGSRSICFEVRRRERVCEWVRGRAKSTQFLSDQNKTAFRAPNLSPITIRVLTKRVEFLFGKKLDENINVNRNRGHSIPHSLSNWIRRHQWNIVLRLIITWKIPPFRMPSLLTNSYKMTIVNIQCVKSIVASFYTNWITEYG